MSRIYFLVPGRSPRPFPTRRTWLVAGLSRGASNDPPHPCWYQYDA